jgi:hypothetical protein
LPHSPSSCSRWVGTSESGQWRQALSKANAPIGHRQQHHAAMGADASAIDGGCYFLAGDRWKRKRQEVIVGHGGRGSREMANGLGVINDILRQLRALCYLRQLKNQAPVNKSG